MQSFLFEYFNMFGSLDTFTYELKSLTHREIHQDEIFVDLDEGDGSEDCTIGMPNRRNVRQRLEQQQ